MSDDEQTYEARRGREGSTWYNEAPTAEDVAAWFSTVPLHEGMEHAPYIAGISMIQSIDDVQRIVAYRGDGSPQTAPVQEVRYTPYVRVDARLAYFWRYVALHESWQGAIEPAAIHGDPEGLPPGFFRVKLNDGAGREVPMIGRSMRARIRDFRGDEVACFPAEVKVVPLLRNGIVDADAFAKASTGAIGRALGAAGMLVLPGTGVATAEDMAGVQDRAGSSGAPTPLQEALAAVRAEPEVRDEDPREELVKVLTSLAGTDKEEELRDWWGERQFPAAPKLEPEQVAPALAFARKLAETATAVVQTA